MLRNFLLTVPLWRVVVISLAMGLYSTTALLKDRPPFSYVPDLPLAFDAALTFAIGMLLLFRTNRAYERWWEARILWGNLVNVSRNLAVKSCQLAGADAAERREVGRLVIGFAHALKDHLRDEAALDRVPGFADSPDRPRHVPSYLTGRIYALLKGWHSAGRITPEELRIMDAEARQFLDICGSCERIKNTPMAVSWRTFTHQCLLVFLLILPWGMVDEFGPWTIPISVVICYFFLAVEAIAMYVEEPFGEHEDHLDLESICRTIERTVGEILA